MCVHLFGILAGKQIADLAGGLDALDAADTEHCPGGQQTEHNRPVDAAGLRYGGSTVQGDAVPEVVHRGTPLTLFD